ncbi:MAG: hypothetical protein ACTSWQ_05095, partial [Candidatus Thorarchaeota archaeon]
ALDEDEDIEIRSDAARVISEIGNRDSRIKLLPLLQNIPEDDHNDELLGSVLHALWPNNISGQQLFETLPIPRRSNFYGAYSSFLESGVCEDLKEDDFPYALNWVRLVAKSDNHNVRRLIDQILKRSIKNLNSDEQVQDFALTCLTLFDVHRLFEDSENTRTANDILAKSDSRRRLVSAMVNDVEPSDHMLAYNLYSNGVKFLTGDDLPWLIDRITNESSKERRDIWSQLLRYAFNNTDSSHIGSIITAALESEFIREQFSYLLDAVELNSDQAIDMRENHKRSQSHWEITDDRSKGPTQQERIDSILREIVAGNVDGWRALPNHLANDSTEIRRFPAVDITTEIGWKNSDTETQWQIVKSAINYLQNGTADASRWLGKSQFTLSDIAPFHAFYILWCHFPAELKKLDERIWRKWGAYFLSPVIFDDKNHPGYDLIAEAYNRASKEIIETLLRIIWVEATNKHSIFILDKVKMCVDQELADELSKLLQDMESESENWSDIASFLIRNNHEPTISRVREVLVKLDIASSRGLIVIAAALLLKYRPQDTWELISDILTKDAMLGKDIVRRYSHRFEIFEPSNYQMLSIQAMKELYIWLVNQFPYNEDPTYDRAYHPSADDHVRELRDAIRRTLTSMGTKESTEAIEEITKALPGLPWLSQVAVEARDTTLQRSWIPLNHRDFLKFVIQTDSILIITASELQELVMEGLREFETVIHGDTALIENLWDETSQGVFVPKGENHFSDNVKAFLEQYLKGKNIVCAREAEVRSHQETDIMVIAKIPDKDPIKVIIESKGCWHNDVDKAMRTQLADRYLRDNQNDNGIYLVGWYLCEKWDKEHHGYKSTKKCSIDQARENYEEQACNLSTDELRINAFVMDTRLR